MSRLLEVEDLQITYGSDHGLVRAVRGVSLTVDQGETVAIVGESGSGKSSVALSIVGLLDNDRVQTAGRVSFLDTSLLTASERELTKLRGSSLAYIAQDHAAALNPTMRIGAQIKEAIDLHQPRTSAGTTSMVTDVLERVGMRDPERVARSYPHEISGGMRQRVIIAMAIVNRPALLIADEPTTALDSVIQKQVLDLIQSIQREHGMAVLAITHNLEVAKYLADRTLVMKDGEVVEEGTSRLLSSEAVHPYTQELVASVPGQTRRPPGEPGEEVLAVAGLRKSFTSRERRVGRKTVLALDGVDFSLGTNEVVAVVGESGSGKSTLARCIAGLEKTDAGQVQVRQDAAPGRKLAPAQQLGYVFQDPFQSMNPLWRVERVLTEPLLPIPGDRHDHRRRVEEAIEMVEMKTSILRRSVKEFSGGERQRIAIARAVIARPRLILLDEPTAALDVSIQKKVLDLLRKIQSETGAAFLLITHDLGVAAEMADRVMVLRDGQIVTTGSVRQVLDDSTDEYVRSLVAAHRLGGG